MKQHKTLSKKGNTWATNRSLESRLHRSDTVQQLLGLCARDRK